MLDNLKIEDIKPSSRRYPAIIFNSEREGDQILSVENLSYSDSSGKLFDKISFNLNKGRVILYSKDTKATTAFYEILNNNIKAETGKFN